MTYLDWIGDDEERFTINLTNIFYPRSPENKLSARPQPESHTEPNSAVISQPKASIGVSPIQDDAAIHTEPNSAVISQPKASIGVSPIQDDVAIPSTDDLNSPSVGSAVLTTNDAPIFFCEVPLGVGVSNFLHRLALTGEKPLFEALWTDPESMDYEVGGWMVCRLSSLIN